MVLVLPWTTLAFKFLDERYKKGSLLGTTSHVSTVISLTSQHMTRSPRSSPSVLAYCKWSRTGGGTAKEWGYLVWEWGYLVREWGFLAREWGCLVREWGYLAREWGYPGPSTISVLGNVTLYTIIFTPTHLVVQWPAIHVAAIAADCYTQPINNSLMLMINWFQVVLDSISNGQTLREGEGEAGWGMYTLLQSMLALQRQPWDDVPGPTKLWPCSTSRQEVPICML